MHALDNGGNYTYRLGRLIQHLEDRKNVYSVKLDLVVMSGDNVAMVANWSSKRTHENILVRMRYWLARAQTYEDIIYKLW